LAGTRLARSNGRVLVGVHVATRCLDDDHRRILTAVTAVAGSRQASQRALKASLWSGLIGVTALHTLLAQRVASSLGGAGIRTERYSPEGLLVPTLRAHQNSCLKPVAPHPIANHVSADADESFRDSAEMSVPAASLGKNHSEREMAAVMVKKKRPYAYPWGRPSPAIKREGSIRRADMPKQRANNRIATATTSCGNNFISSKV